MFTKDKRPPRNSSSDEEAPAPRGPRCAYCDFEGQEALGRCVSKDCNKHFCNLKGRGTASHLILHLVRSKHNEVETCEKNELGRINIECYSCGNKNVFILGALEEDQDGNVLILCRKPCMELEKCGALRWKSKDWKPIIEQKSFKQWLLAGKDLTPLKEPTSQQILMLESNWKKNPHLRLQDLDKKSRRANLPKLKMEYAKGEEYLELFEPLIDEQSDNDRKKRQNQTQTGLVIKFEQTRRKTLAYFEFSAREDFDASVLPGNELKLSYKSQTYDWEARGVVTRITNNDDVCLQLQSCKPPPPIASGYRMEFVWKSTSYNRMKRGLHKFVAEQTSISSFLYYSILGHKKELVYKPDIPIPKSLSAPNLPSLNMYQEEAVMKALENPLSLIQGPPGTGKTITSATLVYHLAQNPKRKTQILVCAPSNIVVDMLAARIHSTGVRVVRFCSKSRESVASEVEFLGLQEQARALRSDKFKEMALLLDKEDSLSKEEEDKLARLRREAEAHVLEKADVVCVTCIASADHRLQSLKFHYVLIDEATQAIEPESLLPLLKGAKHAILVGDHRQLGPVVISREALRAGLGLSLFERLVKVGLKPYRLQMQYRMHPELSKFPSNVFYEGSLQNGLGIVDRPVNKLFPWPTNGVPFMFLNSVGVEEISASGTSYLNRTESNAIEHLMLFLLDSKIEPQQVGIITPYKGQRSYVLSQLMKSSLLAKFKHFYKELEIASVDGFQGREKDYIIISCVRSNESTGIGFLTDPRRMNVSITRAKYGMILVGNAKVLAKDPLWNHFLFFMKSNNLLFEGICPNFRPSLLAFKNPEPFQEEEQKFEKDSQFDAKEYISFDLEESFSTSTITQFDKLN